MICVKWRAEFILHPTTGWRPFSREGGADRHACRRTSTVVARIVRRDIGYRQQQWQIKTAFLFATSNGCSLKSGYSSAPQYTSKFYPHEGAPSWLSLGDGSTQHCRPGTLKESAPCLCCGAVYLLERTWSCAQFTTPYLQNNLFLICSLIMVHDFCAWKLASWRYKALLSPLRTHFFGTT